MSYEEIKAYGGSLRIVAAPKLQEEQIYVGIPVRHSDGKILISCLIIWNSQETSCHQTYKLF